MRTPLAVIGAALVLAIAGCGSDDEATTSSSSSGASKTSSKTTELELDDNYFKPTTVSGAAGSTVKLELKNEGSAEHTFTVDSQKIDTELEGGKTATVSVKMPESGTVQFYCRYHRAGGMVGKLSAGDSASSEDARKKSSY
jgi:plastocyanin